MRIDPSAPAYPGPYEVDGERKDNNGPWYQAKIKVNGTGLPIRLELAARMMAGNMGNPECSGELSVFADYALKAADALIAAYNEGEK